MHLQSDQFFAVQLKADLHWLAAHLTVFHVRLTAGRKIQQYGHRFCAKRTMYALFCDAHNVRLFTRRFN